MVSAPRLRWLLAIALGGALLIVLLLRLLAGASEASAPPFFEHVYVEGVIGTPTELNPLLDNSDHTAVDADLAALLFEGLTRLGPDGQPGPALAETWTMDRGGTTFTFTLRSGLRWHDGAPLTAGDVVFTIRSLQAPDFPGNRSLAARWRNVAAELIDARTVRVVQADASAALPAALALLPILPAHLLEEVPVRDWAGSDFSRRPVGAGPFRLGGLDERKAQLMPFEGSVRGRPRLDLLVLRFYSSAQERQAAWERREIQGYATIGETGEPSSGSTGMSQLRLPLAAYRMLHFNLQVAPLDSQAMRAALVRGLDRTRLATGIAGRGHPPLDTPVLPQTPYHGTSALPPFDRQAAETALDTLGWRRTGLGIRERNGESLRLPLLCLDEASQLKVAQQIARYWSALGVDMPLEVVDEAELRERLRQHEFVVALHDTTFPTADPDLLAVWHSTQARGGMNYSGVQDRTLDELLEQGRRTVDQQQRTAIYQAWEARWVSLLPGMPLYQHQVGYVLAPEIRPAGLKGSLLTRPSSRFATISDWTVEQ